MLDWDASMDSIVPSSLHSFEGDPVLGWGRTVCVQPPRAFADPQVRPIILAGCWSMYLTLAGSATSLQ